MNRRLTLLWFQCWKCHKASQAAIAKRKKRSWSVQAVPDKIRSTQMWKKWWKKCERKSTINGFNLKEWHSVNTLRTGTTQEVCARTATISLDAWRWRLNVSIKTANCMRAKCARDAISESSSAVRRKLWRFRILQEKRNEPSIGGNKNNMEKKDKNNLA